MGKIPERPETIFPQITADYREVFGEELVALILYGSGADRGYVPGKSDLNFLVVLTERGMEDLEKAMTVAARWRKSRVATPLFMTKEYIDGALDAYPIEFLDMKHNHVTAWGRDVLADLEIGPGHLRLQLERELRGKLLLLRQRFLETEGRDRELRRLIRESLPAFLSAFKAILWLLGREIPRERSELVEAAAQAVGVGAETFGRCLLVREGRDNYSPAEVRGLFREYLGEIAGLCRRIDAMSFPAAG
ncbi:MAG: hypothetical protein QM278_12610 [Pseudomonadota bacterium]|nr:hypothetical protein [Pseudomonadota bacterium]